MTITRDTLFVLAILLLSVAYAQNDSCTAKTFPGSWDPSDFYDAPANESLRYCVANSGNTCCTPEYSDLIGELADPLSVSFGLVFETFPTGQCRDYLQDISCVMCSPTQAYWVLVGGSQSDLIICQSYCETLVQKCGDQRTVNGWQVSYLYGSNPKGFCELLFSNVSQNEYHFGAIVNSHNNDCWDNKPECTADSYYSIYTECQNNQRTKYYYLKPEVSCKGGVPLPEPEFGVACALSCNPGQKESNGQCVDCPPGQYSLGGAIRVDQWYDFEFLPLPFATYCTWTDVYGTERQWTETPCGWELNGYEISSPRSLNDSMSAYLETFVTLVKDGEMEFAFKVDSEPTYDGLQLYIDRVKNISLAYNIPTFSTQVRQLAAGYHYIQFVYVKDASISRGADQAVINLLEFTHVNYADEFCTPCPTGTFASEAGSPSCTSCPEDTYTNLVGSNICAECDPTEYALIGSEECLPRPPCDDTSYTWLYGPCLLIDGELKRQHYAVFTDPHICDSDVLPDIEYVECADCEPGQQRVGNNPDCEFCEIGTYSAGNGAPCTSCGAGSEAIKMLVFDEFNELSNGLNTICTGQCSTPGWVLHSDYIDSGRGHGGQVVVTLGLNQTLEEPGTVSYQFSLFCTQPCDLTFSSTFGASSKFYGGTSTYGNPTNRTITYQAPAGSHGMAWQFTKNDPYGTAVDDRAQINYIRLSHTTVGGAIDCTTCKPGFYNPSTNQESCIPADPGYFVPGFGAESQTPCPEGTYSAVTNSSTCISCGENQQTNADQTGCLLSCGLVVGEVQYELSPLSRTDDEMYGPIYDVNSNVYYLNMCHKEHNSHVCFQADGTTPLQTFACQITAGIGQDLGNSFGIVPLRENIYPENTVGVTVHLDHGSKCHNGSVYFDRQTYIDVICSPDAGIGEPLGIHDSIVETQKCVYEFIWYSLYGCPVCSEADYFFVTTECDSNSQTKTKVYQWKDNPRACHGGVSLPPSEILPCDTNQNNVYCGPGTYFDSETVQCVDAPPGSYSIGNGINILDWTEFQEGFSTIGWQGNEYAIYSGLGDSELVYLHNFVLDGFVEFDVYVNTYGDSTAGFFVYLDDVQQGTTIVSNDAEDPTRTVRVQVNAGYHFLRLLFRGGTISSSTARGRGARISNMKIVGISYAAEYPLPCPAGTFSSESGSTECQVCDWNTYSRTGQSSCVGCLENSFSFPHSSQCQARDECTVSDYHLEYSDCIDGQQTLSWVLTQPVLCLGPNQDALNLTDTTIPCVPCEAGSYRTADSNTCEVCPQGKYYNAQSGSCKTANPGYASIIKTGFWNVPVSGDYFPAVFTTGCEGQCICSTPDADCEKNVGWRFFPDYADSGSNPSRPVDSWLQLEVELLTPGSVSFNYHLEGSWNVGLELFINDRQVDFPYHNSVFSRAIEFASFSAELPTTGTNRIRWNYHQELGTNGVALISNLTLTGLGGADSVSICPAGQFSDTVGAAFCQDCPAGTANPTPGSSSCPVCTGDQYSSSAGATHCDQCGAGTTVNSNGTDCETTCSFTFDEKQYDFNPLQSAHGPFALDVSSSEHLWMNLCHKQASNVVCINPYGDPISTYMCQVDQRGNGIDTGRELAVNYSSDDGSIEFLYTDGSKSHCASARTTSIKFVCDPDQDNSAPVELSTSKACSIQMEWQTAYACPICQDSDYAQQPGDCEDGKQSLNTVRVNKCYGPYILKTDSQDCSTGYTVPLFVLVAVIGVIGLLVVIIIVVVIYNRRIHNQYSALVKQAEGQYEMKEVPESPAATTN